MVTVYFRSVCIKGFLSGIDAVFALLEKLITPGVQDYICMYRLSQDHLELFFNAVRRSGEFRFGIKMSEPLIIFCAPICLLLSGQNNIYYSPEKIILVDCM